jgi:hypothetical protein
MSYFRFTSIFYANIKMINNVTVMSVSPAFVSYPGDNRLWV